MSKKADAEGFERGYLKNVTTENLSSRTWLRCEKPPDTKIKVPSRCASMFAAFFQPTQETIMMNELVNWYRDHGVKRGFDPNDPNRETRKIPIDSWYRSSTQVLIERLMGLVNILYPHSRPPLEGDRELSEIFQRINDTNLFNIP